MQPNNSVEIFHSSQYPFLTDEDGNPLEPGFYYWFCQPGQSAQSEPMGAFDTFNHAAAAYELEAAELIEPTDQPELA